MANYRNSILCLATSLLTFTTVFAEEAPQTVEQKKESEQKADLAKVSEAFGHLIGKNIETLGFQFDIAQVIKGLQDAAAGKQSPMSESECVEAISAAQENVFKQQASENLQKAEAFLTKNSEQKNIVVLEEGKLQYKVEKTGNGPEIQNHNSPLIRYTGKYLDGSVFGASKEDELISLDETIPGFSKGLLGMKEGEKRTLYIHPDLGYGTSGFLPPNSLLTFEIELVKANAAVTTPKDSFSSNTTPKNNKGPHEITTPNNAEVIR